MRSLITIFLALHLIHLPVPCLDLDGECRGVPIESLMDSNAWHVLLLGIMPNDDVDQGPIRRFNETTADPTQFPFGEQVVSVEPLSNSVGKLLSVIPVPLPDASEVLAVSVSTIDSSWTARLASPVLAQHFISLRI